MIWQNLLRIAKSQLQLTILHPDERLFIEESENLIPKILPSKQTILTGDLSIKLFEEFYQRQHRNEYANKNGKKMFQCSK